MRLRYPPRNDEIGILASSFDTMRIQFGKLLENIEHGKKDWESTFDTVKDIIILWDKDCRLIRCNKALLDNLDVKGEDIIGKNCHEIFPQIKDDDLSKCPVIETTKTLKPVTREIEILCMHGIFSVSNFPRFDDNGEFVGTVQVMRDITGRKQVEDKLCRSENSLKEAQRISHMGSWNWDIVKNKVLWSDEIYRIFNLNPHVFDPTYKLFLNFVHPDDREFVKKSVDEALYEKKPYNIDHRIVLPDGSERIVNEQAEVVFDSTGKAIQMNGTIYDITERKQSEEALKLHAYQQEAIIRIGSRALTGIGISTLFDEVVASITQILGVEFCKILELQPDCKAFLLIAGVGWKEGYVGHATVEAGSGLQAGYTLLYNKPVIVKDLRTETRFNAPLLLKEHGVISGMSVIIQGKSRPFGVLGVHTSRRRTFSKEDINFIQAIANVLAEASERKEMEIQFRSIIDNTADGIITINEQGIIRLFNPAAEKLFGYTPAEIIGQNVKTLMPEPYHSEHDNYLQRYIGTGKGHIIGIGPREVQGLHSDGTTFPMELAISEMILGKQRIFIGIVRDITERKVVESKLRMSYKMASLGRLTAGVSHEILNPLNIISAYAQLLLMDTEKGSKTEKDLNKIQEEVGRIVKITDGLLRFSRKEGLEAGEVEVNGLLEKIISIFEYEMKLENIKLLRIFEEGLPKIVASSDELRQVFLNLINNAKDAMPRGGNFTISTQSIEKVGNPFVSIQFKDTGEGISEENLNTVFEPFFTTKEEGKGTGLGLSISYGIIESFGGVMSVDSKKGEGATFIIDLPVKT